MLSPQEKLFCFCWLKIVHFFLCRFRRLFDGGANVLYVQLWEAVGNFKPTKCYHTFIAPKKQATMIYNPRLERQWLEEDNKIRQEELWDYRGYYDLLSHFQWSGRPSSGGATIIKIDKRLIVTRWHQFTKTWLQCCLSVIEFCTGRHSVIKNINVFGKSHGHQQNTCR